MATGFCLVDEGEAIDDPATIIGDIISIPATTKQIKVTAGITIEEMMSTSKEMGSKPIKVASGITIEDMMSTPSTSKQTQFVVESSSPRKFPTPTTQGTTSLNSGTSSALSSISGIIPEIRNVVATVDLCCQLDLLRICLRVRCAEYNPRRFNAVIMRLFDKTTAVVFGTGKIVVVGAKSESLCHLAARKYARILQKIGFNVKFKDFSIRNIVATCDVKFPIRIERLYVNQVQFCTYEPELFPALIYRMIRPKISFLVFVTGHIVLSGAKSMDELKDAFENLYPLLSHFRK